MTMTTNPQPGWYSDPSGNPTRLRYWDGTQWTEQYAEAQQNAGWSPEAASAAPNSDANATANNWNAGAAGAAPYGAAPYATTTAAAPYNTAAPYTTTAPYAPTDSDNTLRMVAFIFAVISTVSVCWLIIPLAWMIPMTVRCWGIYKGTKPNTTAFGVCTLIFLSLVGGILLLISKKDQ